MSNGHVPNGEGLIVRTSDQLQRPRLAKPGLNFGLDFSISSHEGDGGANVGDERLCPVNDYLHLIPRPVSRTLKRCKGKVDPALWKLNIQCVVGVSNLRRAPVVNVPLSEAVIAAAPWTGSAGSPVGPGRRRLPSCSLASMILPGLRG